MSLSECVLHDRDAVLIKILSFLNYVQFTKTVCTLVRIMHNETFFVEKRGPNHLNSNTQGQTKQRYFHLEKKVSEHLEFTTMKSNIKHWHQSYNNKKCVIHKITRPWKTFTLENTIVE